MPAQLAREDTGEEAWRGLVEEVTMVKEAMAHVFRNKALKIGEQEPREAAFLYLVSTMLSRLAVAYQPDPTLILATDGAKLYVGPAYTAIKKKLETKNPGRWSRLRYGLVLHEVVHVLYGHPHRMKLVGDPELYNIVADLLVNTIVERKLKIKIPPEFVTLDSFPVFLKKRLGIKLSREKEETIQRIADLFLNGELTTEDVYKIFKSLEPNIMDRVRQHFRRGFFFGHDLADQNGQRFVPPTTGKGIQMPSGGQSRQTTGQQGSSSGAQTPQSPQYKRGGAGKSREGGKPGSKREETGRKGEGRKCGAGGRSRPAPEDIGEGKAKEGREGKEKKSEGNRKGEAEQGKDGGEEETTEISLGELAEKGGNIEKTLREVRKRLGELLEQVRRAMGEYKAIRHALEGGRQAGYTPGVIGEAEYRRMRALTIPIETQFLREVGETLGEPKVTYTRHDEDAYWLPAEEEEERPRVLLLLDSSPSISRKELMLFLNLVRKAMEVYDIEYEASVFSVGEVDHKILNMDEFDEKRFKVRRGAGTVWDKSIADRIEKAAMSGVRLIQVLSDFEIIVSPEVYDAIKKFKAFGGKISCYSVTDRFLDICDYRHRIPI